jgi:hypothetical protein
LYEFETQEEADAKALELQNADETGRQYRAVPYDPAATY